MSGTYHRVRCNGTLAPVTAFEFHAYHVTRIRSRQCPLFHRALQCPLQPAGRAAFSFVLQRDRSAAVYALAGIFSMESRRTPRSVALSAFT